MKAFPVQFAGGLQGVFRCTGDGFKARDDRPVFILINAGEVNASGPYRLYTELATSLADNGFDSLCFDLGGIGGSPDLPDGRFAGLHSVSMHAPVNPGVKAQWEILEAIRLLKYRFGATQFVLAGLCSGADQAIAVAQFECSIVGVVAIDAAGFRTRGFYVNHLLRHYPRRLLSLKKWRNVMSQKTRHYFSKIWGNNDPSNKIADSGVDVLSANDGYRESMDPVKFREAVTGLIGNNCRSLFQFTGGVAHYYNYERQLYHMTEGLDRAQLREYVADNYYPEADHLLFETRHREQLINDTVGWAHEAFAQTNSDKGTNASPRPAISDQLKIAS